MHAVPAGYRPHSLDRCRPRVERLDFGLYWLVVVWCPCGARAERREYK